MSLTLPQIIMLNHSAWVNHERSQAKFEAKQKKEGKQGPAPKGAVVNQHQPPDFSTMNSEAIVSYIANAENF